MAEWENWYSWSRSKEKMFNSCERKYFYRYVNYYEVDFGHELRTIKDIGESMHEHNFLLGNIVHNTIKKQLDQIERGRKTSDPKPSLEAISRNINDIKSNPKDYIIEILNGSNEHTEKLDNEIEELEREAKRQIGIFFKEYLPFYLDLEIISHEKYCELKLDDHKFYVVPDLITRTEDDRVFVTDWKTSNYYDDHQLKMYILWALQEGFTSLDKLRAEFVFLDDGSSKDFQTDEGELDKFKEDLKENSSKLLSALKAKYSCNDFNETKDENTCISCIYKSYCEKT